MVRSWYKNWLQVSKITWGIWAASDKQWKVPKGETRRATFVQSTFFQLKLYIQGIYLTVLLTTFLKIHQIPYIIFETITPFPDAIPIYYFSSNIVYFLQKKPIKKQIFRLFTTLVKIHQISHVIFQTKSLFFFKVCITLQCHEGYFYCIFSAETLHDIDKSSTSKCKFSDLPLLALKFTKLFMSFLEPGVDFSSNFSSLFSVMRQLFCTFSFKSLYALDKRRQSKCKFSDFRLLAWRVSCPLNFASLFTVITHSSEIA